MIGNPDTLRWCSLVRHGSIFHAPGDLLRMVLLCGLCGVYHARCHGAVTVGRVHVWDGFDGGGVLEIVPSGREARWRIILLELLALYPAKRLLLLLLHVEGEVGWTWNRDGGMERSRRLGHHGVECGERYGVRECLSGCVVRCRLWH